MKNFKRECMLWIAVLGISFCAGVVSFVHLLQDSTTALADDIMLSMLVFICSCSIGEYVIRHIE